MDVAVRVEGADELRRALQQAGGPGLVKQLAVTHKVIATKVVRAALPHVPTRSGRLRSSVKALGSQRSAAAKAGGARLRYAPAIHWGRKVGNVGSPPGNHKGPNSINGRPFLQDAVAKTRQETLDEYEEAMVRLVADAIRGA